MKFWKILSYLILQTLPDWRDKFLSYKSLKKHLKLIFPTIKPSVNVDNNNNDDDDLNLSSRPIKRSRLNDDGGGEAQDNFPEERESDDAVVQVTKEVNDFLRLLEVEIDKFNSFVVEKEEEYVIRWKELQDRLAEARNSSEELMRVGREIVDFHGEMVLLENYSALNYTGLVKILKKYDKRSGTLTRLPFIQKVLQEPFYTNDTIFKLVKECESTLDRLFSQNEPSISTQLNNNNEELSESNTGTTSKQKEPLVTADKELAEIENMENMYMKLTLSALRALKEIRSGSSTVNAFSLPPLEEETRKNVHHFVEQVAK